MRFDKLARNDLAFVVLEDRARYYEYSRGSAMECGALFDALRVMELLDEPTHTEGKQLLVRVVSMLSKMC